MANRINDMIEKQGQLAGVPGRTWEWFDRVTQAEAEEGWTCYECDEPLLYDEPYVALDLYDSPFDTAGHEERLHVDNGKHDYDNCLARLEDTSWGDFRYFRCEVCGRMICRQNPKNGWHSQVRIMNDCEEVCLACYEKDVLENGIPTEDFEDGQVSGMFFSGDNREPLEAGYKMAPDWSNIMIRGEKDAKRYCYAALDYITRDYQVVTSYERMAIGGLEGEVTMWIKKKGA